MPGPSRRLFVAALGAAFVASSCATLSVETLDDARTVSAVEAEPDPSPEPVMPAARVERAGAATRPSRTEVPSPAPRPRPTRTPATETVSGVTIVKLRPRPGPGPFSMNLYRKGDFMHQQTKDWCAAGSTQIMMNIIDSGQPNRSKAFQKKLYFEGRRLSHDQQKLGRIGMDLTGWMELLNTRGYGPYVVDGAASRRAAIRKAARAIRRTGKPVGLATWRGAHSWVMSGFTATADPAHTPDFEVKKVYIQDTWYPYVSTIWGASRPPNALVPVAALAEDFLPYRRPSARYPKRDGKFMLILPVLPRGTVVR